MIREGITQGGCAREMAISGREEGSSSSCIPVEGEPRRGPRPHASSAKVRAVRAQARRFQYILLWVMSGRDYDNFGLLGGLTN
jgi:hypothetical protein